MPTVRAAGTGKAVGQDAAFQVVAVQAGWHPLGITATVRNSLASLRNDQACVAGRAKALGYPNPFGATTTLGLSSGT